ncbi:MAG: phage head-tail connector protein [Alphaproteobacteria bacterium]|nr:phage head-tail connector protein [Alphaproteobacteria bacterium]
MVSVDPTQADFGDLTTLTDVKAWLQIGQNSFPSTDDALLRRLITAASQYIQAWLNRQIALQDWIEVRDGIGNALGPIEARYQFAVFPVRAVSLVVIDGLTIPPIPASPPALPGIAAVSTFTTQAGYLFSPTHLVIRGYAVPRKAGCVTMQYTAGYAVTPPDLAQACIELVALRYRERNRIGEVSRAIGGGETVSYSQKDMSDSIKTLIQQYRIVAPVAGVLMPAPTQTDTATLVGGV